MAEFQSNANIHRLRGYESEHVDVEQKQKDAIRTKAAKIFGMPNFIVQEEQAYSFSLRNLDITYITATLLTQSYDDKQLDAFLERFKKIFTDTLLAKLTILRYRKFIQKSGLVTPHDEPADEQHER